MDFLYRICPLIASFELTTESLTELVFQPKGAEDGNGLQESILAEMPTNSVLLIDETKMEPGKIEKHGVENIKALATLIEEQKVDYEFSYYKTELPTTVSCLVLGPTRSMFKNTIHVPVDPSVGGQIIDDQKLD